MPQLEAHSRDEQQSSGNPTGIQEQSTCNPVAIQQQLKNNPLSLELHTHNHDVKALQALKTLRYRGIYRDNGMNDLSVIYFTGAWVEGMYLGAKTGEGNNLGLLLSEQMTIAEILIGGIRHIKVKSDDINGLQDYITDIVNTYDNLESIKQYGEEIDYIDVELTKDEIKLISSKIIELRENLIQ